MTNYEIKMSSFGNNFYFVEYFFILHIDCGRPKLQIKTFDAQYFVPNLRTSVNYEHPANKIRTRL